MPAQITEEGQDILKVRVTGKLVMHDYERWLPELEEIIRKKGKIYVLFEMHDFEGWEISALWEGIKFDTKHFSDIERVAVVGEKNWQEMTKKFWSPFTVAKTRYFEPGESDQALEWLKGDRQ